MNDAMKAVLATRNPGKVRELAAPLSSLGIKVAGLDAFPDIGDVEENGDTFAANALLKARHAARRTGLMGIADDSGLIVDALNGAPGVYSARYADGLEFLPGENRDQRNIRKLLDALAHVPPEKRSARFKTAIAVVIPDGRELTVEGLWEGCILAEPQGENGFGYDPVFFDPVAGKAAAKMTREEKFSRSHRGNALRALLAAWPAFIRKN